MFFAQKLSNLGPVLNKPLLLKRVAEGAQLLGDFCNFAAKIAILTPFESRFGRFKTISIFTINCLNSKVIERFKLSSLVSPHIHYVKSKTRFNAYSFFGYIF